MKKKQTSEYIRNLQTKRIRECMHECGLTQKQIAKELNYTEQHISYVFNGKRDLTVELAIELAKIFSKNRNPKTTFVDIPYKELSEAEKVEEKNFIIENGDVPIPFNVSDDIDYKYLLGETKHKTQFKNLDPPLEENENYLFQSGIKAILYRNGFILCADKYIGADCKILEKAALNGKTVVSTLLGNIANADKKIKLIKLSTGETFSLSPLELFQLVNDYEQAITAITERFFEKLRIESQLSQNRNSKNNINIPKSVLSDLPDTKTLQGLTPENRPKKDPNGTKVDKVR